MPEYTIELKKSVIHHTIVVADNKAAALSQAEKDGLSWTCAGSRRKLTVVEQTGED